MEAQRPNCPACAATKPLPILYATLYRDRVVYAAESIQGRNGYPTLESMERSERGEIALGGCLIYENQPEGLCASCKHEFLARPAG